MCFACWRTIDHKFRFYNPITPKIWYVWYLKCILCDFVCLHLSILTSSLGSLQLDIQAFKVKHCIDSRAHIHETSARIPILIPNLDSSTPKTYKLIYNMYLKCYFVRLCAHAHETSARILILTPNSDSSTPKTHSLTPRTSKSDEIWRLFNFGRFFTFLRHCAAY